MKQRFLDNDRVVVVRSAARAALEVETILLRGIETLRSMLPRHWEIEIVERAAHGDATISVAEPGGATGEIVAVAESAYAPRDAHGLVARLDLMRRAGITDPVLVVAPWLSPRARLVLDQHDVSYLDLTGNAHLRLDSPAVLVRTTGTQRDPAPAPRRDGVTVRGSAAGRVVRYLVDVDWPALLRRRAETCSLFGTNTAHGHLSPTGARLAADRLRGPAAPVYGAVTGSFAVVQRAPVAAPGQLVVYVDDPARIADAMDLLPTGHGAEVVLVRPRDPAVLERSQVVEGLRVVAPSQLVLDSLTGNGPMPAEGEALLAWMVDHEVRWRVPSSGAPVEDTAR